MKLTMRDKNRLRGMLNAAVEFEAAALDCYKETHGYAKAQEQSRKSIAKWRALVAKLTAGATPTGRQE